MKMSFQKVYGENTFDFFDNPGVNLSDADLVRLFLDLRRINERSKQPLNHGLLPKTMKIDLIRKLYKSTMVCIIRVGGELSD